MNSFTFFKKLENAVVVNICRPDDEEIKKVALHRKIKASASMEGDSQIGLVLFIGIATNDFDQNGKEIAEYLSCNPDEYRYKLKKYTRKLENQDPKYLAKIKLIKNYLKFNGIEPK